MKSCKECMYYLGSGCRLHHVRYDVIDPDECMDYQTTVEPDILITESDIVCDINETIDKLLYMIKTEPDTVTMLGLINKLSTVKEKILTRYSK